MFTEIKDQFIFGLKEQEWMDTATRAQARLKVRIPLIYSKYMPAKSSRLFEAIINIYFQVFNSERLLLL